MTNMMSHKGLLVAVACSFVLGCSAVDERKDAYKDAKLLAPLEVPPDLLSIDAEDDLVSGIAPMGASVTLSEFDKAAANVESKQQEARRASGGAVATINVIALDPEKVTIKHERGQYWLTMPVPMAQAWQQVKAFWLAQEISLEREAPELGVMHTAWAEDKSFKPETSLFEKAFSVLRSSHLRDQYIVRIEPVAEGQASEIYVTHRGVRHVEYGENLHWLPRERDADLEAEMIKRMAIFIGLGEDAAQAMLAKTQEEVVLFSLQQAGEDDVWLKAVLNYEKAWREVGSALNASGFDLEGHEKNRGTYAVRGRLLQEINKANVFAAFTDDVKGEKKPFLIKLLEQDGFVRISVEMRDGVELTQLEKETFLSELQDELD